MFKIDKAHPIPDTSKGRTATTVYPFSALGVGESFLAEGEVAHKARIAAGTYKFRHPSWSFVSRREGDGVRIWRTA